MHNFKNLKIWQEAIAIAKEIFLLTTKFPLEEKFGMTSQLRRAAVSVASNIAEGSSRSSPKDFSRFIEIALGSSFELETQIILLIELGYLHYEITEVLTKITSLQKMLFGFKNKIRSEQII